MDLSLNPDQEQLVAAFGAFFAKECPPSVVRDAEPLGHDPALWAAFGALGGPAMALPEPAGGAGASLLDLALVCEQFGAALAPIPLVESLVAARAISAAGHAARALAGALLADPPVPATVALRPAVAGAARLVPAGAVAGIVLGIDDDAFVAVVDPPPPARRPPANLGTAPLADRNLRSGARTVLAAGPDARAAHAAAVDEWRVLMGAALVGLAAAALDIGVDYAKERHQFGVPIGSFQSIARDLADVATEVDGARLLVREAAWAAAEAPHRFASLAGMALLFAGRTAQHTTAVALHVHGGYGFMLEYDIQLYFRRAKAWPLALGDPRRGALHLADTLFGPTQVH